MSGKTIKQDIIDWLNGNDLVYRHIFDYYYPKLFPVCFKSVKKREDCEEMVMNVFFNLWLHRQQVLKVDDFEKYIFRILRNQIVDFSRKNVLPTQDIETLPLERLGSIAHPELTFKELERIYLDAIDKLPEKRREVFLMSREQGLSHQQIAEQNEISVNTVNNHIKSAMKMIRNDLGEYSEALPLLVLITSAALIQ